MYLSKLRLQGYQCLDLVAKIGREFAEVPLEVTICKFICPNHKLYLSKLQNIFVQTTNCICPNCKMYLSKLQNVFVQIIIAWLSVLGPGYQSREREFAGVPLEVAICKFICPNHKVYLSKLQNVFVQIKIARLSVLGPGCQSREGSTWGDHLAQSQPIVGLLRPTMTHSRKYIFADIAFANISL